MTLLLGLFAALILWWGARNAARLNPALTARLMRRVGGYVGLALAGLFLVRGRIDLALLVGGGAVWLLDGAEGVKQRARTLFRRRPAPATALVRFALHPDGRIAEGMVLAGPFAGRPLSGLPRSALLQLLDACRRGDRDGALRLEAYLDGRHPGWRVDAEGDADPRTGRPPDPGAMTQEQAHEILGLQRGASLEEIRAAHRTLMKRWHPDQGGTVEGAARINAARDRLTNRHR